MKINLIAKGLISSHGQKLSAKAVFLAGRAKAWAVRRQPLLWILGISLILSDFLILKVYGWFISPAAVKPLPHPRPYFKERPSYSSIYEENIFHEGPIPDRIEEEIPQDPIKTSLPLVLKGTIVHVNPLRSVATVKGKSGGGRPYQAGDVIENQAKILQIERKKIIFTNLASGLLEFLEIPEAKKKPFARHSLRKPLSIVSKPKAEPSFRMRRSEVQAHLKRLPQILRDARMVPNWVNQDGIRLIDGFRFASIKKGSVYEDLGFKVGDVITKVEGEEVNSPEKALELYNKFQTNSQIQIVVNGKARTYTVDDDSPAEEVPLSF